MSAVHQPISQAARVPRVKGWPIVGVLPHLLRANPVDYLTQVMLEYGDVVALKLGPFTAYLVSNPEHLQNILRDHNANFEKPRLMYETLRRVLGNGLVTSSGDFWLRQRRMIQPHLHRKQLPLLYQDMLGAVSDVLASWEAGIAKGEVFEMNHEMKRITMDVITRTMFGTGVLSEAEKKTVSEAITVIVEHLGRSTYLGFLPEWVPIPGQKQYEEAATTVQKVVWEVIERCRQQGEEAAGLIKMLLNTVDAVTNEQMTDQQLFDEVITIFSAGFETTASVLTWFWVMLDQHPEVLTRLQTEVDAVLGDRVPQVEDLARLDYTRRVFLELMRLYTIVPMLPRQAREADMLGNMPLPAKSFVLMYFHGVHHNPQVWEDPERFDPERFTEEAVSQRHAFAYLPFSGGPRKCAGDELAMMEGTLAIAMLLQRFTIQVLPGQDFSAKMGVTSAPHQGVKATITRRVPPRSVKKSAATQPALVVSMD